MRKIIALAATVALAALSCLPPGAATAAVAYTLPPSAGAQPMLPMTADPDGVHANPIGPGNPLTTGGVTAIVSGSKTRPSNTTAYAAGQALCGSATADCTGIPIAAGRRAGASGLVHGVQLAKNSTGITNATFTIEFYQGTPTLTGIHDGSAYSPIWADINSGAFRGSATCTTPTVNGDNAVFTCSINSQSGMMAFVSDANASIYAVIQVNGAYVPVSGEVFRITLSVLQD